MRYILFLRKIDNCFYNIVVGNDSEFDPKLTSEINILIELLTFF